MDNCGYCSQVKEVLKEKGVEFVDKSTIEHKEEWDKVTNAIHIGITPTVLFKGCYFVPNRDFQHPQQLVDLLNSYEKPKLDSNDLVIERMKTLNYNMHQAFTRMDQLLRQIETKLNIKEDEHKSTS